MTKINHDNIIECHTPIPTTGTTANAYATAKEVISVGHGKKTFILKNTGLTNSLKYKIELYSSNDSSAIAYPMELDETTHATEEILAPSEIAVIVLNNEYAKIVVSIKSNSSGNHTTYQCDYVGGK